MYVKHKAYSRTLVATGSNGTAMHDNSILYNGKTQSGASHLAAATFIHTIETLENAHEMLLRNTYAILT